MAGLGPAFPTGKSQPLSRLVHTSKNWLWTADDSPSPIFFFQQYGHICSMEPTIYFFASHI